MKKKIFDALKTSYSNLGLGDDFLRTHAAVLDATGLVTDENLADIVAKQKDSLEERQKEFDRARTAKAELEKKLKEAEEKLAANGGEPKDEPKDDGNIPQWAKDMQAKMDELVKENNNLREKNEQAEAEKSAAERMEKIIAKAKELGISEGRIKQGFVIAEDADDTTINAYLSEVRTYEVAAGLQNENGFKPSTSKEAEAQEAKAWAEMLP